MATPAFAFGSYIPGTSPVHGMNAQVKIILACVFSIAVFFVETWPGLLALSLAVCLLYALARIPLGRALAGLRPVVFILLLTVLAHVFAFGSSADGGVGSLGLTQELALSGSVSLSLDGLFRGLFFALRIAVVIGMCSVLTFSSTEVEICDGICALLRPLRALRVPVEDVSMVISLALRLIPTTAEEARTLADARRARGAAFDGGLAQRVRAWASVLSPLFVRLFKRADVLARAMDARCYAGAGRTHMRSTRVKGGELAVACVLCLLVVCWCVFA